MQCCCSCFPFFYDHDFRPFTTMVRSKSISYNSYYAQILVMMRIIVENLWISPGWRSLVKYILNLTVHYLVHFHGNVNLQLTLITIGSWLSQSWLVQSIRSTCVGFRLTTLLYSPSNSGMSPEWEQTDKVPWNGGRRVSPRSLAIEQG